MKRSTIQRIASILLAALMVAAVFMVTAIDIAGGTREPEAIAIREEGIHSPNTTPKIDPLLKERMREEPDSIPVIIDLKEQLVGEYFCIQRAKTLGIRGQERLMTLLRRAEVDARNIAQFWIINAIAATVPANAIESFARHPDVQKVWLDREIRLIEPVDVRPVQVFNDWGDRRIFAPAMWERGFDGTGIRIAILDTGIDKEHPDLKGRVILQEDFTGDGVGDRRGHGTHVAGIAAGARNLVSGVSGVAYAAYLLDAKVLGDDGKGRWRWVIAGIQWAVDNQADVINMSLGGWQGAGCARDSAARAATNAVRAGAVVVVAAGNAGPGEGTIGTPAVAHGVIAVAASDEGDRIAAFSSRGPTGDGRVGIDLVAPGVAIIAPNADWEKRPGLEGDYVKMSGTSMAAPHVAGAAALLLQAPLMEIPRPNIVSRTEWAAEKWQNQTVAEMLEEWRPLLPPDTINSIKNDPNIAPRLNNTVRSVLENPFATVTPLQPLTHVVIHHTTCLPADDWRHRVQKIWEEHTFIRTWADGTRYGWGDIGYHFLIAPDGTIYEGRRAFEDGKVRRGAHVVGHNIGTLGIAFLGRFCEVAPTDAALRSAERLIAWICAQNDIDPLGSGPDYTGKHYDYIAGHRALAAPECPGQSLYNLLQTIRQNVANILSGTTPVAVTSEGYDRMQDVLDDIGRDYVTICPSSLKNYDFIRQFSVIFINCAGGLEPIAAEATESLRKYVDNGGIVYASDWAFTFLENSFPGYVSFVGYVGEGDQDVDGDVVDAGLAHYLGTNTIPLHFDLGGWVPIESVSDAVRVYVKGDVTYWKGSPTREKAAMVRSGATMALANSGDSIVTEEKPIVISFEYGSGTVIFTSFHHRAQGPMAAKLMEYLALTAVTEHLAKENNKILEGEGYEVVKDVRGMLDQGETATYTYQAEEGESFKIVLNWPSSVMKLSVYSPDGALYDEVESDTPPIGITVVKAKPGNYTYAVTAVYVPYDNYEWAVSVGKVPFAFELTVYPDAETVVQGEEITDIIVTAAHLAGITEEVTLTYELPAGVVGVTVTFEPQYGEPTFESTMTIAVAPTATVGTHAITIIGTSAGEVIEEVTLTLTVETLPFDFGLAVEPTAATVTQGEEVTDIVVTATHLAGITEEVILSADLPGGVEGITITFEPVADKPTFESQMTIAVALDATLGEHEITIIGTSYPGEVVEEVAFTLTVFTGDLAALIAPLKPGGILELGPGIFKGDVTIDKPITIIGVPGKTTILGGIRILPLAGSHVAIENLIITDYTDFGIWIEEVKADDVFIIRNNVIQGVAGSLIGIKVDVVDAEGSLTIEQNTITGNETAGIKLLADVDAATIQLNDITGNTVGLELAAGGTADAARNWWGDISGPKHETGNPSGMGDRVIGPVIFEPWLTRDFQTVIDDNIGYFGYAWVDLDKGWNILSTPFALNPAADTWGEFVTLGDGLAIHATSPAVRFDAKIQAWVIVTGDYILRPCDAIYVRMAAADKAPILVSPEVSVPSRLLHPGWNLVGLAHVEPMKATGALTSVWEVPGGLTGYTVVVSPPIGHQPSWIYLRGKEIADWQPGQPLPDGWMERTRGYWVFMLNEGTLAGFTFTPLPLWY